MARVHVSIVKGLIAKSDIVIVYIKKDQKKDNSMQNKSLFIHVEDCDGIYAQD